MSLEASPSTQCDQIRALVGWFGTLDCKKVPHHESALEYVPDENAVVFRIGGEIPKVSGSWKNEFRDNHRPRLGSTFSYHLETKFLRRGIPERDPSVVIAQWHDRKVGYDTFSPAIKRRADKSRPPLSLRVINHELYVILWNDKAFDTKDGRGNGQILYSREIDFKKWYVFDFEITWSATQGGLFQMQIDGETVVNYQGPIGYAMDTVGSYFKFGAYTVHPFENFGEMSIAHRNYSRSEVKVH